MGRFGYHSKEELNLVEKVVRKVRVRALMRPNPPTKMSIHIGLRQPYVPLMEVMGITRKAYRLYQVDGHWMQQDYVGLPQIRRAKPVPGYRSHVMCQWEHLGVYLLNQQDVQAGIYHRSLHEQRGNALAWLCLSHEGRFWL